MTPLSTPHRRVWKIKWLNALFTWWHYRDEPTKKVVKIVSLREFYVQEGGKMKHVWIDRITDKGRKALKA